MTRAATTRRALGGAAAAMMLMVAPAAGSAKAAGLDGELLAACARFAWLEGEYLRLLRLTDVPARTPSTPELEALRAQEEAASDEQHELGEWMAQAVPQTPEGLQAKASAVLAYLGGDASVDMIHRLQLSIIRHVAGEARGAERRPKPQPDAGHIDAELIRICAQHTVNREACNTSDGDFDDDDPAWLAYSETRDAISEAQPKTLQGVLAVARAAVAESGGEEPGHHGLEAQWAWAVMSSLLRLSGEA